MTARDVWKETLHVAPNILQNVSTFSHCKYDDYLLLAKNRHKSIMTIAILC